MSSALAAGMKNHIQRALTAKRESKYLDFKSRLDFSEPHSWCEIIKDIIAMANSGGGVLIIGLDNRGQPTGFDPTPIFQLDEAEMINRIEKYTGVQFDSFSISEEVKAGNRLAAILVEGVSIPIVFTKPGTYAVTEKNKRQPFLPAQYISAMGRKASQGTLMTFARSLKDSLNLSDNHGLKA